jgi:predicted AAA+ superfamily ATPase
VINREIFNIAFDDAWGRQMRFITGPRQAGKTTVSKQFLAANDCEKLYYLWDLRSVRNRYRDNELFFTADMSLKQKNAWVCFDEIHKMPKWKNILKGIFDAEGDRSHFIVTGSAKLNLMKRAGDSLAGRYFTFHMMPLTLREISGVRDLTVEVPESAKEFIEDKLSRKAVTNDGINSMLEFGGFPEPFVAQSKRFYRKWSTDYAETVIREDIGSLTRIIDRENIYGLYDLLPGMAGSPISESSLASHLQISPVTVKRYLHRLEDFYLGFSLPPYSKNIKRALLKSRKFYIFDWARIDDEGDRYETFVACQLRAMLYLWADASGEDWTLFYIRNKQKQETDFLIVHSGEPWLLIEAKLSDGPVPGHHMQHAEALGVPFVQLCLQEGVATRQAKNIYRASAGRLLG